MGLWHPGPRRWGPGDHGDACPPGQAPCGGQRRRLASRGAMAGFPGGPLPGVDMAGPLPWSRERPSYGRTSDRMRGSDHETPR